MNADDIADALKVAAGIGEQPRPDDWTNASDLARALEHVHAENAALRAALAEALDALQAGERVITDAAEHCVFETSTSRKRLEDSIRNWELRKEQGGLTPARIAELRAKFLGGGK